MPGRRWTDEETEILARMYPDHLASEVAGILGRSVHAVHSRALILGISCTKDKQSMTGRMSMNNPRCIASRFQAGHVPINKGCPMDPGTYAKVSRTMFRRGHPAANRKPVGTERIRKDGYVDIKVADPNVWKMKHRLVWEEAHGPVPKGHIIRFRNGDTRDCRLENLFIMSRADQMAYENSMVARYPRELVEVIRAKAALARQLTIIARKENGKKQHEP